MGRTTQLGREIRSLYVCVAKRIIVSMIDACYSASDNAPNAEANGRTCNSVYFSGYRFLYLLANIGPMYLSDIFGINSARQSRDTTTETLIAYGNSHMACE